MAQDKERQVTDRRSFLKLASVGTVATGVAAIAGQSAPATAEEIARDDGRYAETAHVRRYYDLAKF